MSRVKGDPMLIAVAQEGGPDMLHRLPRADLNRYKHGWVDSDIQTVVGMDTDGVTPEDIYCIEGTRFRDTVHVIDAETGAIKNQIQLDRSDVGTSYDTRPDGFCMDKTQFYITFEDQIAVFDHGGRFVDMVEQPRGRINGMTRHKEGFLVVSAQSGTMLMLDSKLNAQDEVDLPTTMFPSTNSSLGLHAIAMDYYMDMNYEPKIGLPGGTIEPEPHPNAIANGWHSDHHPDCKWRPRTCGPIRTPQDFCRRP